MKAWIILIILVTALASAYMWMERTPTEPERVDVGKEQLKKVTETKHAKMTPGRIIELRTTRGPIDFVLFERDCPITTGRIAELVMKGAYNGIKFPRVEKNTLIQTGAAVKTVPPIGLEIREGLRHAKGAVGMARTSDPNSATSSFYILLEPLPQLDLQYTVFGRVIRGMDTAMKIKKGDSIKSAVIRPLTDADRKRLNEALTIESERRTQ